MLEKYTIGEVTDLVEGARDPKHPNHKRARLITVRDMVILTTWLNATTPEGRIPAAVLLDRIFGKASDRHIINQTVTEAPSNTAKQEDELADQFLMEIARRRAAAAKPID